MTLHLLTLLACTLTGEGADPGTPDSPLTPEQDSGAQDTALDTAGEDTGPQDTGEPIPQCGQSFGEQRLSGEVRNLADGSLAATVQLHSSCTLTVHWAAFDTTGMVYPGIRLLDADTDGLRADRMLLDPAEIQGSTEIEWSEPALAGLPFTPQDSLKVTLGDLISQEHVAEGRLLLE